MIRWVAKYCEEDLEYLDEIKIGYEGSEYGFEIITSNNDDAGIEPAETEDEAISIIEENFGIYDTFQWLSQNE